MTIISVVSQNSRVGESTGVDTISWEGACDVDISDFGLLIFSEICWIYQRFHIKYNHTIRAVYGLS